MNAVMRATFTDASSRRSVVSHQAVASHVQAQPSHLQAVDLFCGFGGVTEGLKRAGLEVALAVDFDTRAVRSHRAYHPEVKVVRQDVSQVRPSDLAGRFVWASPSCRPYSMANTTGPRGKDHPEYFPLEHLFYASLGARVLVIENVPGLAWTKEGREELSHLERICAAHRVSLQFLDCNALDFGLIQSRRRLFLVLGLEGLLLQSSPGPRGGASHPTVTTRSPGDVSHLADLQGLLNPLGFSVPDWRSGRRSSRSHVPVAGSSTARRLIGNAIPPVMAEGVARMVLGVLK